MHVFVATVVDVEVEDVAEEDRVIEDTGAAKSILATVNVLSPFLYLR